MNIKLEIQTKFPNAPVRYVDRYVKFIEACIDQNKTTEETKFERHHILPKSKDCFPEYIDFKAYPSNKAVLTLRQHFVAHWMCAKIFGGKQWLAFNQMKRTIPGEVKTSIFYKYSRIFISEQLSKANTGRKQTEEQKLANSLRMNGTLVVKRADDPLGIGFRTSTQDPKYLSGEFISETTGRKHSEQAILNLIAGSGVRDKVAYHSFDGTIAFFDDSNEIPSGWAKGLLKGSKDYVSDRLGDTKWGHNPITKETYRIPKDEEFPEGVVKSRGKFNNVGLAKVNTPEKVTVYDMKLQKYILINRVDIEIWQTTAKEKSIIVKYKNFIVDSTDSIIYTLGLDVPIRPYQKRSNKTYAFRIAHQGKTLRELGFDFIKLSDYEYQPGDIYVRKNRESEIGQYRAALAEIGIPRTAS